jgi:hypothetical protein
MAGAQKMPVVLSWIRLPAVARRSRMVTSESDEILAKHRLEEAVDGLRPGGDRGAHREQCIADAHEPP